MQNLHKDRIGKINSLLRKTALFLLAILVITTVVGGFLPENLSLLSLVVFVIFVIVTIIVYTNKVLAITKKSTQDAVELSFEMVDEMLEQKLGSDHKKEKVQ